MQAVVLHLVISLAQARLVLVVRGLGREVRAGARRSTTPRNIASANKRKRWESENTFDSENKYSIQNVFYDSQFARLCLPRQNVFSIE